MDERDSDDEPMPSGDAAHEEPALERATPTPTPSPKRKRHWALILLGVFVALPLVLFVGWTAVALNWSYAVEQRAGFIQKFSEKGWLCKTWEGELAMANPLPGAMPEKFEFSVRDDSVAHQIQRLMGSRVAITYEEHRGVPLRCFGETEYYVTGVRPTK
jgi:ABC-type phosphate/phosphonate transport system permease subunit